MKIIFKRTKIPLKKRLILSAIYVVWGSIAVYCMYLDYAYALVYGIMSLILLMMFNRKIKKYVSET
jgi:hypothetical protein